jgi:hypothetical protein
LAAEGKRRKFQDVQQKLSNIILAAIGAEASFNGSRWMEGRKGRRCKTPGLLQPKEERLHMRNVEVMAHYYGEGKS